MLTTYIPTFADFDARRWFRCVDQAKQQVAHGWNGSTHSEKFTRVVKKRAEQIWYGK